jgi:RNA polymerase sigma-70 factor, ECF subfamily
MTTAVIDATGMDDRALLEAARGGDRRAMERLLAQAYDAIWPVCRRICGSETDAADAAQEAVIAVMKNLHRFDGRSRFTTWVYRIATNASLDELRRRRRRPVPGDPSTLGDFARDPRVVHADEIASARVDIDRALQAIPAEFRAALALRELTGLDYAEISEVLGIPPGTVRSRIARGRAALAAQFPGAGFDRPERADAERDGRDDRLGGNPETRGRRPRNES